MQIVAGASHIDHADVLRAGAPAGSSGTGDGAFDVGHVLAGVQLRSCPPARSGRRRRRCARAWSWGGPGSARLVIDVDSTICEVEGQAEAGRRVRVHEGLGLPPDPGQSRADTGEIVHARMRKGSANTARGARPFHRRSGRPVRRAGAAGEIVMRFDSGFWSKRHHRHAWPGLNVRYTMAVRTNTKGVAKAIAAIDEDGLGRHRLHPDGQAQVAETDYGGRRLIVRRTRLTDPRQARLWPDWRHFAFLTDLDGAAVEVDAFHRPHAIVELAIRDLKEGSGLEHCPSGNFSANCAWLPMRRAGPQPHPLDRHHRRSSPRRPAHRGPHRANPLIAVPARLVNRSGTPTLRGPLHWPWADTFTRALRQVRALPAVPG